MYNFGVHYRFPNEDRQFVEWVQSESAEQAKRDLDLLKGGVEIVDVVEGPPVPRVVVDYDQTGIKDVVSDGAVDIIFTNFNIEELDVDMDEAEYMPGSWDSDENPELVARVNRPVIGEDTAYVDQVFGFHNDADRAERFQEIARSWIMETLGQGGDDE